MKKIFTLGLIIGCVGIFAARAELVENVEAKESAVIEQVKTEPVKVVEQKVDNLSDEEVETMIEFEEPELEEPEVELEPVPMEDTPETEPGFGE